MLDVKQFRRGIRWIQLDLALQRRSLGVVMLLLPPPPMVLKSPVVADPRFFSPSLSPFLLPSFFFFSSLCFSCYLSNFL